MNVKVSALRDPGASIDKPYCNTGVLLVQGDELTIQANGAITVDDRQTWYNPYGVIIRSVNPSFLSMIHSHNDAYRATGYPEGRPEFGDRGVVGSLIGWIENGNSGLEGAFVVGDNFTKTIARGEEGFLYLAVNDTRGAYCDNHEEFSVTIQITNSE